MSKKETALEKLRAVAEIVSNRAEAFTAREAMLLAVHLRFLLAYIEDNEEVINNG